ncbi:hypothetical protein Ancab_026003 [Ancistrocladus abbreviatus]
MANPGTGTKFVSVNLNKSYGQSSHSNPSNGTYGSGRGRASGYGGGGTGMVVLSRPRSSHKAGPKLSVPPPLNLPSLRKEHERFDPLGSVSGTVGGGGLGSGARPTSSGTGWLKPSTVATGERDGIAATYPLPSDTSDHAAESVSKGSNTAYMPPSARLGTAGHDVSSLVLAEKATVLRGEDFPSLRATIVATSGPSQKQKDALQQKQRQGNSEVLSSVPEREGSHFSSHIDMRPQVQSPHHSMGNGFGGNGESHVSRNSQPLEQSRKQEEYFPGPLPLVRLNPRSDWADDERDTSHGFTERGRDNGFSRNEAYWDRDYDLHRSSILPHKPAQNHFGRWGQRDDDIGKALSNEVPKADPQNRDARMPSREGHDGNSRRASLSKDGFGAQEVVTDRIFMGARTTSMKAETSKENKYIPPQFGGNARDDYITRVTFSKDSAFGRRDAGYGQGGRQQSNNSGGTFNVRGAERNIQDRYGTESNRHKVDAVQNNLVQKSSFSASNKGFPMNDPLLNFGREKRSISRGEKPFIEDPFLKDWDNTGFDGRDPFSGGLVGVVKRKKDVNKQVDFHDPVRESFEAELERVQKMQEQERQRINEEQERALEKARREEEERQRLAREQEQRQRQLEEEAREAAWRAEQERLEAIRRAEEQRIAREEEKRRILMEEERRKQAAKQKLLELEEKMARRQAETAKTDSSIAVADEKMLVAVKERDVSGAEDLGSWEDSERMVERITNSASSDSSSFNRSFDVSRAHSVRDGPFALVERGKAVSSWRRDAFENGNGSSFFPLDHDDGHQIPRRDASLGGRAFPQKDFSGGAAYRGYYRGGVPEPHMDNFAQTKGHRWSISGDGDLYGRNTELESDFHENVAERFGDMGWSQGHPRRNLHSPYPEQLYQNPEQDELYSIGRSRYSARQPRVLPPPSLTSMHRTPFRIESEHAGPSTYGDTTMQYNHALRSEPTAPMYDNGHSERQESSDIIEVQEDGKTEEQKHKNSTPRCDSQSSLSVSSPPTSPTHLSHDDLDESGDSPVASAPAETIVVSHSGSESVILDAKSGEQNMLMASSSISLGDDEEWTTENELQEQEEYDEDVDGYHEEDEVRGDDENVDRTREFEGLDLEGKDSNQTMDNLVLGFDQGVEVGMPSDEYEKSPRNDDSSCIVPQVSVGISREQESLGGGQVVEQNLQVIDGSPNASTNNSKTVQETEEGVEDMVNQSIVAPHTSASSELLEVGEAYSGSVLLVRHSVASSSGMNSNSSVQVVTSNVSTVQSQSELPVKLQFGLFSGPSLIPSPIPAIQIGSIQMPLQLHPQVAPSLTHMHPPQPPLLQFGQIRYPSTLSQGILPLAPQSMSFVQPNVTTHYSLNQKLGGHLSSQPGQDSSTEGFVKDHSLSLLINNNHVHPPKQSSTQDIILEEANLVAGEQDGQSNVMLHQSRAEVSPARGDQVTSESGYQVKIEEHQYNAMRNSMSLTNGGASEGQLQTGASSQSISGVKDVNGRTIQNQLPGSKGRKFAFTARNPGQKSFLSPEGSLSDSYGSPRRARRGAQRMEFRIRQGTDRRQSSSVVLSEQSVPDPMSICDMRGAGWLPRGGLRKEKVLDRPKQADEPEIQSLDQVKQLQETVSGSKTGKGSKKDASGTGTSNRGEGSLKRNISSEDDVDAPLQSGVVRIFQQPGIEAPSDEDDFIEVRSKRQMVNDRREQREKEIKAKSSYVKKGPRKPHSLPQRTVVLRSAGKITISSSEAPKGIHGGLKQKQGGLTNSEALARFNNVVSHPLAPIGTPAVNSDPQSDSKSLAIKPLQTISLPVIPSVGQTAAPGLTFETKNEILDGAQTSLGWGNSRINQQTQLDEAMKPARLSMLSTSVGDTSLVSEPSITSSSILVKDTAFSSATSPINSLLAGEKIQFGAVTSSTILPPSNRVISHGIGPPGPSRTDFQVSRNLPVSESECALLFEKENHSSKSSVHLEDSEAEAEAAASAVAVAAISNDEVVVNGLDACSVSISDTQDFRHADVDSVKGGIAGEQQSAGQSKVEDVLSVSLPADLSVETSISLWPPLPSPHSSNQILSPFPGGTPSHFPFYDINPMLRSPIFAFGPHEESASTQPQPQKSSASGSGPLGTWQQCHSSVDSFYGSPAGFTGPFINPSSSIPGVQGPPHMVVYNHFAPVGQFGQVGLSYMGTTYIPSGKQPDWKHNPTSVAIAGGEGDMKNLNMVSTQRNPTSVPPPVQHLAPGSPLLSMASPLAMFDVSPFQSSSEMSMQGCWTPITASPLHSIPQSTPLQQQPEGAVSSQFRSADSQSLSANRLPKSQTASAETSHAFVVGPGAASAKFPDELVLVDPPISSLPAASSHDAGSRGLSGSTVAGSQRTDAAAQDVSGSSSKGSPQGTGSASKTQASQQKQLSSQHYNHPSSHNYQRGGGASQKNGLGAEWSNRKIGFHGRNHSSGGDRGFPPTKVKQIYVAKQSSTGTSAGV